MKKISLSVKKASAKVMYCGARFDNRCVICNKEVYGKEAHLHHLGSRTKKANMANLWATDRQDEEAKKCVLLCDKCHIRLHKVLGKVVTIKQSKAYIKANKIR